MHITHITDHHFFDPDHYSGTPYWMVKGLSREENLQLHNIHISVPQKLLPPLEELAFRCKQWWSKYIQHAHLATDMHGRRAQHIAQHLQGRLALLKTDVILTTTSPLSTAYLDTDIPIVYWTEGIYAGILAFYYSVFESHHTDTIWDAHNITHATLMKAKRLIFPTQWAARTAVEYYGVSPDKIRIVPFGANIAITHTRTDVENMIQARNKQCIKFLFVGKDWYRKGGDIVLDTLKQLYAAGHAVELTIVGAQPPSDEPLPSYVKCKGFISKRNPQGIEKLKRLYQETHFLFLPSRAETFGIVFAEANAFGVPCITTNIGGIPDVVKDGINGMRFPLESTTKQICDYIVNLMNNDAEYTELALSSFNEYQTRLNWQTACGKVKKLIAEII